jgi:hypothetical protein
MLSHIFWGTFTPPTSSGRGAPGIRLQEAQSWAASIAGLVGSQFLGDLQRAQVVFAPMPWSYVLECFDCNHCSRALFNCSVVAIDGVVVGCTVGVLSAWACLLAGTPGAAETIVTARIRPIITDKIATKLKFSRVKNRNPASFLLVLTRSWGVYEIHSPRTHSFIATWLQSDFYMGSIE